MTQRCATVALLCCVLVLSACRQSPLSGSDALAGSPRLDAPRAEQLRRQALQSTEPGRALALLKDAQRADPFSASIANNLGVAELHEGNLAEAARQFTLVKRLAPNMLAGRINLALVYERAGRFDDACAELRDALEVDPGSIGAMQELARVQVRSQRTDGASAKLFEEIALRGETARWRDWAKLQLAQRKQSK